MYVCEGGGDTGDARLALLIPAGPGCKLLSGQADNPDDRWQQRGGRADSTLSATSCRCRADEFKPVAADKDGRHDSNTPQRKPPLHLWLHTSRDEWMEAERTGRTVKERDSPVSSGPKRSALCWAAAKPDQPDQPDQPAHHSALLTASSTRGSSANESAHHLSPALKPTARPPNRQTEPTTARGGHVLKQLKTSIFFYL